jgi:hypothetical protein
MDRRSTLRVSEVLGAGRQEQSWDEEEASSPCPAHPERSLEIGALGMAGLRITGAPAGLSLRERRVIQPGGSSSPLKMGHLGLLSSTFPGSLCQVDYRRRLEMNTQDSDKDVLFRQDRTYPDRGAPRGFTSGGRADGGDHRAFLPMQPLEELRHTLVPESSRERGRSPARRTPDESSRRAREIGASAERGISHASPVCWRTGAASGASAAREPKDWDQELRWAWATGAETADPGHRRRRVRDHR